LPIVLLVGRRGGLAAPPFSSMMASVLIWVNPHHPAFKEDRATAALAIVSMA